jgi:CTP-dependent riboflavin kinase
MKKILLSIGAVISLFAFTLQTGKTYKCFTEGISYKDQNGTHNIPVNKETKEALKKALGDIYSLNVKVLNQKEINVSANGKSEVLPYRGDWKGYRQYVSKSGALIFMPDKNKSSKNAALIVAPKKLVVYYQCK